jgi:hypothetical protein
MLNKGDKVLVVDYMHLNYAMSGYRGKVATVTKVSTGFSWSDGSTLAYNIDIDGGNYNWCGKWLEPVSEISEVDITELIGG